METNKCCRRLLPLLIPFLVVTLLAVGCQRTEHKSSKEIFEDVSSNLPPAEDYEPPKTLEPSPEPTIPEVNLSEKDAADSILGVGQTMPNAALRDMNGRPVELHSLFGHKATVICFWNTKKLSCLQAIQELSKYIATPYGEEGVAVIGIDVGDDPSDVREKAKLAEAKIPILLDPRSEYFKQVAVQTLPRVYLLDAKGKILWFDIDYSHSMQRDLLRGIDIIRKK